MGCGVCFLAFWTLVPGLSLPLEWQNSFDLTLPSHLVAWLTTDETMICSGRSLPGSRVNQIWVQIPPPPLPQQSSYSSEPQFLQL